MKKINTLLGASIVAAAMAATPAQALTFNFINTTGAGGGGAEAGTTARRGFEIAASYWSSVFTDNVTVNLAIGYGNLGTGIIASAGSNRTLLGMTQAYGLIVADAKTAVDTQAIANLPTLSASAFGTAALGNLGAINTATTNGFRNGTNATNGYTDLSTRIDADGGINNSALAITRASAKALGVTVDVNGAVFNPATPIDAVLTFNNTLGFDFDPRNGIASNQFDFIGVAIHEIGHALGFTSGVDSYDSRTSPGQTDATRLNSTEGLVTMNTLDLFRYSDPNRLDWSTQNTHYFSLDKGATQVFGKSLMSLGTLNGDGRQASHFKDSPAGQPQIGVLDPTSGRGQMQEVTALDLVAFDAIGWDVNVNALAMPDYRKDTNIIWREFYGFQGVPEPGIWAQLIVGFGLLGGALRRLRRRVTKLAHA